MILEGDVVLCYVHRLWLCTLVGIVSLRGTVSYSGGKIHFRHGAASAWLPEVRSP